MMSPQNPVRRLRYPLSRLSHRPTCGTLQAVNDVGHRFRQPTPRIAVLDCLIRLYDNLIIMETKITATEAARRFSDILNRVQYRSESFVVERNGRAVCRISPEPLRTGTIADLFRIMEQHSPLDKDFANDIEEAARLHNQPVSFDDPWSR